MYKSIAQDRVHRGGGVKGGPPRRTRPASADPNSDIAEDIVDPYSISLIISSSSSTTNVASSAPSAAAAPPAPLTTSTAAPSAGTAAAVSMPNPSRAPGSAFTSGTVLSRVQFNQT